MTMFVSGRPAGWRSVVRKLSVGGVVVAALTACGGGQQLVPFAPNRILSLGDEASVITATGQKYTVNALQTDNVTLDCAANPIWVQAVANTFGLVFPQCNPNNVTSPTSRILATPGAKVADFTTQVNQQFVNGGFTSNDLVTVMVGANDVLEQYRRFPGVSADTAIAAAEAAGSALAVQVNRIADTGAKVLLAKVLDLGQTPFAIAEQAANKDTDRAALLTNLAARFNAKLRVGIVNDGRKIGLVQSDERIQLIVRFPSSFNFTNVTQAACLNTVVAPNCTTQTLTTDSSGTAASASAWLWADNLNLSAGGQSRLGEVASFTARNNPF
jgi:phospholipase/lecithinase/hemolysin